MKNIFSIIITLFLGHILQAQVYPHALGVRVSTDGERVGIEGSFQKGFALNKRVEFDLGMKKETVVDQDIEEIKRIFLATSYQMCFNLSGGLNCFAGGGTMVGVDSIESIQKGNFSLSMLGQLGVEYDFAGIGIPLLLTIDTRPTVDVVSKIDDISIGVGFGARYIW